MRPFRKKVALAIDGGGFKGVMVAKALAILEEHLGKPCYEIFKMAVGTSTGSIISTAIGTGMNASQIYELYSNFGKEIFRKTCRYYLWPLTRYKYSNKALIKVLKDSFGEITMGDFWKSGSKFDLVITVRDLVENRSLFVKPWKKEYQKWKAFFAVLASCSVPTYFPVVEGRYIDGGVGSYSNPCYIAAYEAINCLNWEPEETTLISIGTGRVKKRIEPYTASHYFAWQWISPILDTFLSDTSDQQVRIVRQFFRKLDFRRFQIDIEPVAMDDPSEIKLLTEYGEKLGRMILKDKTDTFSIRPAGFAK